MAKPPCLNSLSVVVDIPSRVLHARLFQFVRFKDVDYIAVMFVALGWSDMQSF